MGMFDPLGNSMNTPSSVHAHQQQSHSQGTPHHPHQHNQQNYPQQNQHFNSNMSNNQHIEQKHNPVGSWQRGGWDSGIQSGKKNLRVALIICSIVCPCLTILNMSTFFVISGLFIKSCI